MKWLFVNFDICVSSLGQALHAGGFRRIPWEFKVPLLATNLPAAATQFVPAMRHKDDAACRAVAIPKHYEGKYTTTRLVLEGRAVEHMICAHVSGNTFLVHPGGKLDPHDLVRHKMKRNAKRSRSSLAPAKLGQVMPGCALSKLMAVATYRAEIERAMAERREVDVVVADALLEKNPFVWGSMPRTVLALWTCDGKHYIDEIQFPKTRL